MNLKKTIHSLSFVVVASISSFTLAQGVGVGAGVGAGAGSSTSGSGVSSGARTNVDAGTQIGGGTGTGSGRADVGVGGTVQSTPGADRSMPDAKAGTSAATDASIRNQQQKAARDKRDAEEKARLDARIKAQGGY